MTGWYDAISTHPNEVGGEVLAIILDSNGNPITTKATWTGERFDHGDVQYWRWLKKGE